MRLAILHPFELANTFVTFIGVSGVRRMFCISSDVKLWEKERAGESEAQVRRTRQDTLENDRNF